MSEDLQRRKLASTFKAIDITGDGIVDLADFYELAERMCARLVLPGDYQTRKDIYAAYHSWWEQLRGIMDTNDDGMISEEEYVNVMISGVNTDNTFLDAAVIRAVLALSKAADTDGDGYISAESYVRLLDGANIDSATALAGFKRLDTAGIGRITIETFVEGVRDLLSITGFEVAGSHMLGTK